MTSHPPNYFPHRRNWDNSYDSICPRCYRTVANRRNETELAFDEHDHVCDAWQLKHLRLIENPSHAQTQ